MRKSIFSIFLAALVGVCSPISAKKEHILPIPQKVETNSEGIYSIPANSSVVVAGIENNASLIRFFNEFGVKNIAFNATGNSGNVIVEMVNSISGAHNHTLGGYGNEAYTIEV